MIKPRFLLDAWRSRALLFREHAEEPVAIAYERCAEELEQALEEAAEETLTLIDAATESGYSADHLGRLVRQGAIPNAGRPGAPRIRRRDLPRKASEGLTTSPGDAIPLSTKGQIVRSVITSKEDDDG